MICTSEKSLGCFGRLLSRIVRQSWRVDLMIALEERQAEPHPSLTDAERNEGASL